MIDFDRSAPRLKVAQLIADNIPEFKVVKPCIPSTLIEGSPYCTVESGGWKPFISEGNILWIPLTVGVWIRRDDGETAETLVDQLAVKLYNVLNESLNVRWARQSVTTIEKIDAKPYRIELHFIEVQWWIDE